MNGYDSNLDYKFFEAMDIKVVQYQPWQFGLFHPDVPGKFVWYPARGSLIYELPDYGGNTKIGEFTDSEDVYKEIMKKTT